MFKFVLILTDPQKLEVKLKMESPHVNKSKMLVLMKEKKNLKTVNGIQNNRPQIS